MSLKEDLAGVVPPDMLRSLDFWDVVGDVAIVSLPPSLDAYKADAADAILARRKNVKAVLNKLSKVEGEARVPRFELLKGSDSVATYREYGFTYRFDLAKVFFNRHLSYERHRIADAAVPGETVLIPFAGVGPFVIPIAARGCRAIAIEINTEACRWLASNARRNGVEGRVDVINADVLRLVLLLKRTVDRAVVPTPYGMDDALGRIAPVVKRGGMLHFYTFKKKHQVEGLIKQYESSGFDVELCRRCGNVAPAVYRWVFDLRKRW